jgi:hypothetical protein
MGLKTGNSVASTVSVAGVALPAPTENQCQKLSDQNEKDRERIENSDRSPSERKALTGGGSTIANFKFTPARGASVTAAGSNRNEASSLDENHFKRGGSEEQRKKKQSGLCVPYRYHGQGKRSSGHSESRIVETLFKKRPGSPRPGVLLISVDLKKKQTDLAGENVRSKMPCGHCHRLLCAAKKCGMRIFLCDANNQPQELTDDMCEGNPGSRVRQSKRRKLKRKMGE